MIEKIKVPDDLDAAAREAFKMDMSFCDIDKIRIKAAIELLTDKINEIIDVINGKETTIIINAVDAKSFDEMIKNNPGCIVQYFGHAPREDPPDDAE